MGLRAICARHGQLAANHKKKRSTGTGEALLMVSPMLPSYGDPTGVGKSQASSKCVGQ
jgi:hypothetical protein